uniref:Uncharacterized protein n=1 Tax=Dunaliella tertiolecta TaxID=3047 RepID=A0A7S3QN50_DUNTE
MQQRSALQEQASSPASSSEKANDGALAQKNSSEATGAESNQHEGASKPRAWGSWANNTRIKRSGVSLLRGSKATNPAKSSGGSDKGNSSSSSSKPENESSGSSTDGSSSNSDAPSSSKRTEDGAVILSQRVGHARPWKRTRAPAERQATVKEAMRAASAGLTLSDEDGPSDPTAFSWADNGAGSSSSSRTKWWQRRFQVLYMPTVCSPDGSFGFVQLDVSLSPDTRDVRVVTFEDRHDCMHCLTIMKQWPEYEGLDLNVHALQTKFLEEQVQKAWLEQVEAAESTGIPPASRPSGLVVLRRGKLAMRVGMSMEDFSQLIVYQAAAQVSLSKVGYEFDDF